ncbi:MAG: trypsin-like peptidase domain-containing protein [Candidatus Pacebacteria bacterium]|nr:trypsin-like peptidase domain-containing protein [Candidatus Paceibacterota bacterium]
MEELTKSQIILLTLLVSFITSIATGIVTVSLLDQAPPGVTQTINRVVQTTVEKVVPGQPTIVTKEVPVTEEDLIVSAVNQDSKSLVHIKDADVPSFSQLGLVVSKDGLILSDNIAFNPNGKFSAVFSDGKSYPILAMQTTGKAVSLFKTAGDSSKDKYVFNPAILSDSNTIRLGQTVISLGANDTGNVVGVGVISGITMIDNPDAEKAKTVPKIPSLIKTNLNPDDGASGYYLLNLSGEIIGIHLVGDGTTSRNTYTPVNLIKDQIPASSN